MKICCFKVVVFLFSLCLFFMFSYIFSSYFFFIFFFCKQYQNFNFWVTSLLNDVSVHLINNLGMHFEIENINNNNESLYFTLRHVLLAVIHVGIHPRSVKQQQYVHLAMQCYIFCIRNKIDMLHINWNDVKEKKITKECKKRSWKEICLIYT